MSFFDDDEKMYVPMSIDRVDTTTNYFFSERKIIEMVIAIIPYLIMLYPLLQGGIQLIPVIIITLIYGFLYFYFLRFRVFEEAKLRKMVREVDNNKQSGVEKFWNITKITDGEHDDGVIHYDRVNTLERGLVVTFDRGSLIGLPEGSYTAHREAKMTFLRELGDREMNFKWYELPDKNRDIPPNLVQLFNNMTKMDNPAYKQLLRLQIDYNVMYTMSEGEGYKDYILITNTNFTTMKRFKSIVEDIIHRTLSMDSYIVNPRVLTKREVEDFFGEVLLIDRVTSSSIRRGIKYVPFDNYAKVHRVVGEDGRDIPLEFIDHTDIESNQRGKTLDELIEEDNKQKDALLDKVKRMRENEMKHLDGLRVRDVISGREYEYRKKVIMNKYNKDEVAIKDGLITKASSIVTVERQQEINRRKKEKAKKEIVVVTPKAEEIEIVNDATIVDTSDKMRQKIQELRRRELENKDTTELTLEELMERQYGRDTNDNNN